MRFESLGFPKVDLAVLPTPFEHVPRFSRVLGKDVAVFVKRDDATGLGMGGNKARKLEFLVAEALSLGRDTLITCGGPQSNHARMTAAAARKCGLDPVLVLDGDDPGRRAGNLLLDELLGAEIVFSGDRESGAMMPEVARELEKKGRKPYIIPLGGSNALGSLGYVSCVEELTRQAAEDGVSPEALYVAAGSCGTLAGLVLGKILFDAPFKVIGVAVSSTGSAKVDRTVQLVMEAANLLRIRSAKEADGALALGEEDRARLQRLFEVTPETVREFVEVIGDQVGKGYGIPTPECLEAISLMAKSEGLLMDPVYTGKALAGLIADIRKGRWKTGQEVVFLHTGGVPADFAFEDVLVGRRNAE